MESDFTIVLANAQRPKAIPRKKTDTIDCKRIANLRALSLYLFLLPLNAVSGFSANSSRQRDGRPG
jgi:hypothetical protein